jgi:hypothetical protein
VCHRVDRDEHEGWDKEREIKDSQRRGVQGKEMKGDMEGVVREMKERLKESLGRRTYGDKER